MGSLGKLRRGSEATVILLLTLFSLFLLGIVALIDYFLEVEFFPFGLIVLILVCAGFILLQWLVSPAIVRWAAHIKYYIKRQDNPWLYDTVQSLASKAQVPMPKVAVINDPTPNAFVFGRTINSAELVVHIGLLERLNKQEVEGVIAHEIGHLRHRDVITMTLVSAIPIVAYILARGGLEMVRATSGGRSSKDKGGAVAAALAVALISYFVYFITQMLVLHLSRTREYYADSYSAAATGNPRYLRSALVKIAYGLSLSRVEKEPSGLRAFFIGDPVKANEDAALLKERMAEYDLNKDGEIDEYELRKAMEHEAKSHWTKANELFSTHPPTYKRILMLEELEEEFNKGRLPKNIYQYA